MAEKPPRSVRAVPRFLRSKRRLPERVQEALDVQVREITDNPLLGEPKTGALRGVRVVKFKVAVQQYLLAYLFHAKENAVELIDAGVHENFYRDLKDYLDTR